MGVLVHGQVCHGYTFLPNIKHGSNITIETLHRVLHAQFDKNGRRPFKPRVFFLQLDNTTKQCKSQYVLGYLALLIAWFVFDEIILSFLMVGHTHEDIDQLFSRVAIWLRKHNATSRIGFREAIINAFKGKWSGKTVAADIDRAANLSDWLKPILAPMSKKQTGPELRGGITEFHQFKLTMLRGQVIMRVRKWCGDNEAPWSGLTPESTHHVVFKEKVPAPDDLRSTCPPAQRSTKPTDPSYMEKNKKGEVTATHTTKTRAGVEALIKNRDITGAPRDDLRACLTLMESAEPLPIDWDMSMYNVHIAGRNIWAPAPPVHYSDDQLGHGDHSEESDEKEPDPDNPQGIQPQLLDFQTVGSDSDLEQPPDNDGYIPNPLLIGSIYLVRLESNNYSWGIAKYITFLTPTYT